MTTKWKFTRKKELPLADALRKCFTMPTGDFIAAVAAYRVWSTMQHPV